MGRIAVVSFAGFVVLVAVVGASDVPGSKDPAFLKRYAGSEIVFSLTRSFDAYPLVVADPKKPGATVTENHEGTISRLLYRIPPGHTALELLRNYEQAAKRAGLTIAYEGLPCQQNSDTAYTLFAAVKGTGLEDRYVKSPFVHTRGGTDGPFCFFTAKGKVGADEVALTVASGEKSDRGDQQNYTFPFATNPAPTVFNPGEMMVMVDVVTIKAVVNNMVEVKAADIADVLRTKGSFNLYGIYFDTDKTVIKPESQPTIDEVASLLRIDQTLKLEVAGHTDRTGAADHNMKLSQGRAQAVVDALVKKGVVATRLTAKGYGDSKPVAPNDTEANRAKNRRVELRKL